MQIRTKLTFYYVLLTASLLLASFVLIFFLYKDTRSNKFNTSLKNRALTTANLYFKLSPLDSNLLRVISDSNKDLYDFEKISIFTDKFKELYSTRPEKETKNTLSNLTLLWKNIQSKNEVIFEENDNVILGLRLKFSGEEYLIVASAKDSYGLRNYENLKKILLFVSIIVLSLLALTGWIFTKRIMNPISNIMNQVDEISPENLSSRLETLKSKDELSRLINTFNLMLTRIENAFNIQKRFTSNASHELKNPLTIITSQLEVTLLNDRSKDEYKNICISVLEDIKRLNEILNQLLLITKLSNNNIDLNLSKIRIDELLWDTRSEYLNLHPDAKIEIDLSNLPNDDKQLFFMLNQTLMKTSFWNLIENGVKFSTNKSIYISLEFLGKKLKIIFRNDGEKISDEDIPHLFEPFYRSQKSLGIKGYGIGLSIVKQISELYNIELQHVKTKNQYNQFELIFTSKEF